MAILPTSKVPKSIYRRQKYIACVCILRVYITGLKPNCMISKGNLYHIEFFSYLFSSLLFLQTSFVLRSLDDRTFLKEPELYILYQLYLFCFILTLNSNFTILITSILRLFPSYYFSKQGDVLAFINTVNFKEVNRPKKVSFCQQKR